MGKRYRWRGREGEFLMGVPAGGEIDEDELTEEARAELRAHVKAGGSLYVQEDQQPSVAVPGPAPSPGKAGQPPSAEVPGPASSPGKSGR